MKNKIFTIIILFAFFSIFLFMNPEYTGYTTYSHVQPDIELDLTETEYNIGNTLEGTVKLTFNGPINSNSEIILSIDDEDDKKTISKILSNLGKTPSYGDTVIVDDTTTKVLEFTEEGNKKLALKIQKGASLSKLAFKISGEEKDGSYPEFPKVNILEDESSEFVYLGSKTGWDTTELSSPGLTKDTPDASTVLLSTKYYCELIDLPYSKDFKIIASYSSSGVVKGKILPAEIDSGNVKAYKSLNECTFKTENSKKICELSLDIPLKGENLVCISSSATASLDLEYADSGLGYYGYTCDKDLVDNSPGYDNCAPKINPPTDNTDIGDFFITTYPATYSGEFNSELSVDITDLTQINDYLQTCDNNPCIIRVSVSSDSKGTIRISELDIRYGTTKIEKMWDIVEASDLILKIDGEDLTELTIPLSVFNLTVPTIIQNQDELVVKVSIGTESDEDNINVYKTTTPGTSNFKNKLSSFTEQQKEVASSLGYNIDSVITQINNYEQQIQTISNSTTLSDTEKDSQIDSIEQALETLKQTVPSSIKIKKSVKNLPTPGPTQIPDIYLSKNQRDASTKQHILNLQSNVNIKTDLISCDLVINDVEEEKTIIKKTISGVLTDIYLIEEIPKTIASSTDEIEFRTPNYELIQSDPVVRWSVSSLPLTILYILSGDATSNADDLITTAIPKTISSEVSEAYEKVKCGDGVCTTPLEDKVTCPEDCMKTVNWWFVIILFALLIGGIYYLNFYKGRLRLKKVISEKPTLFGSASDENNLRNYVRKSLSHGIPRSRIRNILLAKGWSEDQINHIFRTL